jgi:hypothetical protein
VLRALKILSDVETMLKGGVFFADDIDGGG